MLWGALDWQQGSDNPYSAAQTVSGGPDAVGGPGSIGVRRSVLVFDRKLYNPADDDIVAHFDWLNLTGGAPDDTWTTSDYTTMEAALLAFWTSWKPDVDQLTRLREIRWYRVGPGVVKPNPAERVFTLSPISPGTLTSASLPPQVCTSVTFRTAVRRSWGRTYMPWDSGTQTPQRRLGAGKVDQLAGYANTLLTTAAAADFHQVVTSMHLSASLNVENVEVDDILDVIRSRRWKHTLYRKVLP